MTNKDRLAEIEKLFDSPLPVFIKLTDVKYIFDRVKKLEAALEFYAEPTSIEKFLKEVKIKGTENTRPMIAMGFYEIARKALEE